MAADGADAGRAAVKLSDGSETAREGAAQPPGRERQEKGGGAAEGVCEGVAVGVGEVVTDGDGDGDGVPVGEHDGAAARSGAAHAAGQGQGTGAAPPPGQKEPTGHAAHVAFDAAPAAALHVPAAHGVASTEAKGQKEPGGQVRGAPEEQK